MENPFDEFFSYDPRKDLEQFSKVPTEVWLKLGEQKALENFHLVSRAVPAYRDFLAKNKVNPEKIRTIEDFKQLPLTTKENYFKKYPLNMLVMGGDLSNATAIHSSSGSTGKPLYWPKSVTSDINSYKGVELIYTYYFDIDKINTLLINSFSMGPWPAGEIVHTSAKMIGDKGLKLSVVSPGLQTDLFFTFFEDLANKFEQVIIAGYPSFLRNLVDEGLTKKINFKKHNIKIITGGEKYSENWRNFMTKNLGLKKPYKSIASVLGSAETGVTSISTPFTDYFRIFLHGNKSLTKKFFDRVDLPSITQFIPPARHIEIVDDDIVLTTMGFIPLIRYDTKDYGQILAPKEVISSTPASFLKEFSSLKESYGIPNLPILSISGRSDGVITFYALNIYLEQIAYILDLPKSKKHLSGRCIVKKLETAKSEPVLKLILELKPGARSSNRLKTEYREFIANELAKINQEYSHLLKIYQKKAKPIIELKEYQSAEVSVESGKGVSISK
jgi:phenylacetate-CoA ligase